MRSYRSKEAVFPRYKMYKGIVVLGDSRSKRLNDVRSDNLPTFHPEFGRFMLESTPGKPWGIGFKDLLDVEPNMKQRSVS